MTVLKTLFKNERFTSRNISVAAILFAAALYAWWFSIVTIDTHRGLGTSAYDLGLYDQGVWLLSRFKAPFVTLMGRNMFGDHASLVLILLAPLYWLFPGSETLLVVQSMAIAAGSIPLYLYARRRLNNDWLAVMAGMCWLLHPAVSGSNFENFHPDSMLGLFVPLALYAALESKWRLYIFSVILCALVKEDVVLVLVPLGVWVALRRDRRIGYATIAASVIATLAGMFILMRSLIGVPTRNGWRIPFGGFGGFIKKSLTDPSTVLEYLSSEGRLFYIWQMVAPVGVLFVLMPDLALVSGLVLLGNIVSTFWYQFHIGYHYSLIAVPALIFGSVYAIGRVSKRSRILLCGAMLICSVTTAVIWGSYGFSRHPQYHWPASHPVAVAARDIMKDVPDDAVISVYHSLAPHLAHREKIYMFPNPFRVLLYGVDISLEGSRLPESELVEYVVLPVQRDAEMTKDWNSVSGSFELVRANEAFELYGRSGG